MIGRFRKAWRHFKALPAGQRFQERYQRGRGKPARSALGHVGLYTTILVLAVIGFILVFIPGPAVVFFAAAGMLLAGESLAVAKFFDAGELRARALIAEAKRRWRK